MPAHNVEPWVEEAILTIRYQTFTDLVLVVVNDKSSDNTGEIARRASKDDQRVHVIDVNYGDLNLARYTGLSAAQECWGVSPFVAFPDGDDVRDAAFFENCLPPFDDPAVQAVYTGYKRIDKDGVAVENWLYPNALKGRLGLDDLLLGDFPAATTSAITFRRTGLLLPFSAPPSEDYDMLARILARIQGSVIYGVNQTLMSWRIRPGQWTQAANTKLIFDKLDRIYATYVPLMSPSKRWEVYQIAAAGAMDRGLDEYGRHFARLAGQLALNPETQLTTL